MFNLLHIPTLDSPRELTTIDWQTIGGSIAANLETTNDYYRSNYEHIREDHVLLSFLKNLHNPSTMTDDEYLEYLKSVAFNKTALHGFTSIYNTGKPFYNMFYPKTKEIIIAYTGQYDLGYIVENWEEMNSVRVIRHDYTDLDYLIPRADVKRVHRKEGIAVILVDVILLAMQYKKFRARETLKSMKHPDYSVRSDTVFIYQCVLNNMLRSHIDQVIINHFRKAMNDPDILPESNLKPHFLTLDIKKRLEGYVRMMLNRFKSSRIDIYTIMSNIRLAYNQDSTLHYAYPYHPRHMQDRWAYLLASYPILKLGIDSVENGKNSNNKWISRLDLLLIEMSKSRELYQPKLSELVYELSVMHGELKKRVK